MGVCCAVYGCFSSRNDKTKRSFYRFPLDESRSRQWIRAAGRNDLKDKDVKVLHNSYRICDIHFVPTDFFKRNLKQNAVPTLNLPQLEENNDKSTQTEMTQTDVETQCNFLNINMPSTSKDNNFGTQTVLDLTSTSHRKRKLSDQLTDNTKRTKVLEDQLNTTEDDDIKLSPTRWLSENKKEFYFMH